MERLVVGDSEIVASAAPYGADGFVSVVIIRSCRAPARGEVASRHEWIEPVFDSEAEALRFAWRRATTMARSLAELPSKMCYAPESGAAAWQKKNARGTGVSRRNT